MSNNYKKKMRSASSVVLCAVVIGLIGPQVAAAGNTPALAPAAGMFLVAAPQMRDPRFKQAVVLLVEHTADGSLGLIVNKKTDLTIKQAFPEFDSISANLELFFGGPVQMSRVGYIYSDSDQAAGQEIMDGVYWGTSYDHLRNLLREREVGRLRIFVGYAGWGPGQLQFELSLDDWQLLPASAELVFTEAPRHLWRLLNHKKSGVIVQRGPLPPPPTL